MRKTTKEPTVSFVYSVDPTVHKPKVIHKGKVHYPLYVRIGFAGNSTFHKVMLDNQKAVYVNKENWDKGKCSGLVKQIIKNKEHILTNVARALMEKKEVSFKTFTRAAKRAQQNIFDLVRDHFIAEVKDVAKNELDINHFNLLNFEGILESENQLMELTVSGVKKNPFLTYNARVLVALHAYRERCDIDPFALTVYHWENENGRAKFKDCMQQVDDLIASNKAITDGLFKVGVISRKFAVDFMPNWGAGERYAQAIDEIIDLAKIKIGK